MSITTNLITICKQIIDYCQQYQRPANSVQLLAVSKTRSVNDIQQALNAGQTWFGENYVQEALKKIRYFEQQGTEISWHFIGPIQSNKTKQIANHFAWVHSVDRLKIAERLSAQRDTHLPALNICLQVNIDDEPQKAGVSLTELPNLITAVKELPNIKLQGLMAIPKADKSVREQRASFAKLRQTAEQFDLPNLSMGMSHDFEAAIAEGATIVRVGTGIFGARA